MDEHFAQENIYDIYRQRFEGIIGQPAWFYALDAMTSPNGDTADVPVSNYRRLRSDDAQTGLLVNAVVEKVTQEFTPQYIRDPTEETWVVHLRHTDITDVEGGHHLTLAKGGPRSVVRVDRVYGWYEDTQDQAPEERGLAA